MEGFRIVLLGKTGSGKSSLANTLCGEKDAFKTSGSANSATKLCQSETKTILGRRIQLIDTPGLFDTDPHSLELSPALFRCIIECAPGPHAFLIVMQKGRFTREEQAVVQLIRKNFSEEVLKYTTVVFTHGDDLDEGENIKEWVKENEALNDLVQKCGGRCHVFDNKYWKNSQDPYRNNQYQIEELLKIIEETVRENGGKYYTNELMQKVHKETERVIQKIKQANPEIPLIEMEKMAKDEVFKENIDAVKIIASGALMGALFGSVLGPLGTIAGAAAGAGVGLAGAVAVLGAKTVAEAGKWLLHKFF